MSEKTEMLELADELARFKTHCKCTDDNQADVGCDGNLCIGQRDAILAALRAAGAEPVGYGYSAEIQSAHGMHLHVSREKAGVYDTPLFLAAIPAPAPASGREAVERCIAICMEEAEEWDSDRLQNYKNYAGHCANRIETEVLKPSGSRL